METTKFNEGDRVIVDENKAVIIGTCLEQCNATAPLVRVYFLQFDGQPIGHFVNAPRREHELTKAK
jgi:hypothetical protein